MNSSKSRGERRTREEEKRRGEEERRRGELLFGCFSFFLILLLLCHLIFKRFLFLVRDASRFFQRFTGLVWFLFTSFHCVRRLN